MDWMRRLRPYCHAWRREPPSPRWWVSLRSSRHDGISVVSRYSERALREARELVYGEGADLVVERVEG